MCLVPLCHRAFVHPKFFPWLFGRFKNLFLVDISLKNKKRQTSPFSLQEIRNKVHLRVIFINFCAYSLNFTSLPTFWNHNFNTTFLLKILQWSHKQSISVASEQIVSLEKWDLPKYNKYRLKLRISKEIYEVLFSSKKINLQLLK